jgi:hypothetical protein
MLVRGEQLCLQHRSVNYAAKKVLRHGAMAMDKKQWKKAIEAKQESKSHFVGPLVSFSLTQTIFMADREMKRRGLFFLSFLLRGFFIYIRPCPIKFFTIVWKTNMSLQV